MKLTNLRRPPDPVGPDLVPRLAAAIGKTITNAGVVGPDPRNNDQPNSAWCEGDCTEADRAKVQAALDSYTYDPDYFIPTDIKRLKTLANKVVLTPQENLEWRQLLAKQLGVL